MFDKIYIICRKKSFYMKQKFYAEKKLLLRKKILRKKRFVQKIYVLLIKIYIFFNEIIIPQKRIFDQKIHIC